MKATKILIAMLASAFIVTACDPIEDEDLRDKYVTDAGTPITKEALQAAISITQPFPNQDGVVEGDQYIALKNSRPDIGGSWHIYNPQNEMFRLLGTKRSFSQNETFFFSHPYPLYPALFRLISHF